MIEAMIQETVQNSSANGSPTVDKRSATWFKPGNPGGGRRKLTESEKLERKYARSNFLKALDVLEQVDRKPFFSHVAEQSKVSEKVTLKVLDKILPNAGEERGSAAIVNQITFVFSGSVKPYIPQVEEV